MLTKTGALRSPAVCSGRSRLGSICQPLSIADTVLSQQQFLGQQWQPLTFLVSHGHAAAVRCSCSTSTGVSQAGSSITSQVAAALQWQHDCVQQQQHTISQHIDSRATDHQHLGRLLHTQHKQQQAQPQPWPQDLGAAAALHAEQHTVQVTAVQAALAADAAAAADWRVLQLQDMHDQLSAQIVSCRTIQQLSHVAVQVCQQGNKLQVARLTVMAALLIQEQQQAPGYQDAAPQPVGQPTVQQDQHLVTAAAAPSSRSRTPPVAEHSSSGDAVHLLDQVVAALITPTKLHNHPALLALSSRYLAETLYALSLLYQQLLQQQQQQELLQQVTAVAVRLPQQAILPAVHACSTAEQLLAVVTWLHDCLLPVHVKAAFVQLARLYTPPIPSCSSNNSSSTLPAEAAARKVGSLLLLLLQEQQQQQLQPHAAASILWSLGQLQQLLVQSQQNLQQLAQQLLHVSLQGLHTLNPRVSAMMLHGAAKLRLQLPAAPDDVVERLMQHTEQQLQLCDPQAVANMLWSFAQLQLQPSDSWMGAFYRRSLQLLQPQQQQQHQQQASYSSSSSRVPARQRQQGSVVDGRGSFQQRQQLEQRQQLQQRDRLSMNPLELAAMLSSIVHLQLHSPSSWWAAAACSCQLQLQHFGHQELALMLWSFAKVQQSVAVPEDLLRQAGRRIQQLLDQSSNSSSSSSGSSGSSQGSGDKFSPKSVTLLLYAVVRLRLQHQEQLLQQLWQQLKQGGSQPSLETVQLSPQDVVLNHHNGTAAGAPPAAAAAAAELHRISQSHNSHNSSSSSSRQNLTAVPVVAAGNDTNSLVPMHCQSIEQLAQYNAQDLALLVWTLANRQQQDGMQPQQQLSTDWVMSYLTSVTHHLEREGFTTQGLSMMLWGLGTLLATISAHSSSSSRCVSSQQQQAVTAAFWTALEQQTVQRLGNFSGHELCDVLWGAGVLGRYSRSLHSAGPSFEWGDLLACQCLDGFEQLTSSQLLSVLQGLVRLQHPSGLHMLKQVLSHHRLVTRAQELLLLLRACVMYKHTPEQGVLQWLLAVTRQQAVEQELTVGQVAQVLYLLGKMQQQHNKRQNHLALQQMTAAKSAALASYQASNSIRRNMSSSTAAAKPGIQQEQQLQQAAVLQPLWLVPASVQLELVQLVSQQLADCDALEVALMMWGLSQLVPPGRLVQQSQQQQQHGVAALVGTSASPEVQSTGFCSANAPTAIDSVCSSRSSNKGVQQPSAVAFVDTAAGSKLLQEVYSFSLQHTVQFAANELAILLYAVHRLGVVRPPACWLNTVAGHLGRQLGQMHGQGLAMMIMSLSGFDWAPPSGWLSAFVDAVVAVEAAGGLKTDWQQAYVLNGLSALDPIMGQTWLQRRHNCACCKTDLSKLWI